MTISQGAASNAEAMTEPRPRLTSTTGSVQQNSVVNDDVSPISPMIRSRMIPPAAGLAVESRTNVSGILPPWLCHSEPLSAVARAAQLRPMPAKDGGDSGTSALWP